MVTYVALNAEQAVSEVDLDQLCLDNLARFKRPKSYRFVEELPKNNYGEVLKNVLRNREVDATPLAD